MALIVQKYGGSSLADAEKITNVAKRIGKASDKSNQIVVVVSAMGDTTDDLIQLASCVSERPEPRELDLLLSSGELVSCTLMAMALRCLGYQAISLTGLQAGIQTDTAFGRARISGIDPHRIRRELELGKITIVAGFQGFTEDMDVTTLGRGGSDTTAVALAAVLEAERCEVYTDVEGIYTADPRVVPEARKIDHITFEEMLELAAYGAKMHPRSIELGKVYNVPIYIASSISEAKGTLVNGDSSMMEHRVKVTGIAADRNVAKITLRGVHDQPGIAAALFEPLSDLGISIDTIVQNASSDLYTDLSFTVARGDLEATIEGVRQFDNRIGAREVLSDRALSKVSIVGAGMMDAPGYAAKMFRALADASINIDMITTSEIRITCIIAESRIEEAVRVLHKAFELEMG
ncbi:aspartate kinase [SAR202 cluster bacterium AD-804-J14_MRT_500m]|nr:aspartate kinase [SAR202 cluster bacterium AD-804-J14_MRT_500m]